MKKKAETNLQNNYTYILECKDGSLYTGWTNDIKKRVEDHNSGKGAKYTKARRPVSLVYYEIFRTKEEAMKREYAIKQMTRKQKLKLAAAETNKATSHINPLSQYEHIHHDEVADTSAQNEQVEDLVTAEILMPAIEDRQFQCVDNAADSIYNTAGQKPSESGR